MNRAPTPYDHVLPVTITPDRYGGVYSGGAWLAFPLDTTAVPDGPFSGDVPAATWWADAGDMPIGRGGSPDEAYANLVRRPEAIPPTRIYEPASELNGTTWDWQLRWPAGHVTIVSRSWRGDGRGPQPWTDTDGGSPATSYYQQGT